MSQALYRNMSLTELVPFALAELDALTLVSDDTAALAELVSRIPDIEQAVFGPMLDDYNLESVEQLHSRLEKVQDLLTEFEFDGVDDVIKEMYRLKKFAQQINDACDAAGIEINT